MAGTDALGPGAAVLAVVDVGASVDPVVDGAAVVGATVEAVVTLDDDPPVDVVVDVPTLDWW